MKEHIIQRQIVEYLKIKKILVFAVPNGFYSGIQNKIAKSRYINKLKAEGYMPGVSDLIVVLPKRTVFIEVKAEKGKQQKSQEIFEKEVKKLGFEYYVVRSIEDVERILGL